MAIGAMRALRAARAAGARRTSPWSASRTRRRAAHTDPPLTTVHQPVEAMGREMVRLLLARIGGGTRPEPLVVLPTHLVVRGSA